MQPLIDSHCHLDDSRFDLNRVAVVQRARDAGVHRFVVPAVRCADWQRLQQFAAADVNILPAFGLHPWFCNEHRESDLQQLPDYLTTAVAVGECGLDGKRCDIDMQTQLHWFRSQLTLAAELDLPVIVHAYGAVDAVTSEIRRYPGLCGVIHSFSGSLQQADQLINLGFYLGFGGGITYERASRLREVVKAVPLERLLIETDAPDQPPAGHQGQENEPAFLIEILASVATLRDLDAELLAECCNQNAKELFSI